jgi:amidase
LVDSRHHWLNQVGGLVLLRNVLLTNLGLSGQEAVNSVNGPMARSLDDIEFFAKNVVNTEPWKLDPKCLPIPWRPVEVGRKLRLGVIWNDGIVV